MELFKIHCEQDNVNVDTFVAFENLMSELENLEASEEAIKIKKILISVVDTFGKFINTFKTNLTRTFKDVKRSELKYFIDSNITRVKSVSNLYYNNVMNLEIQKPTGLKTTYFDAISTIHDCQETINVLDSLNSFYKILSNEINKELSRKDISDDRLLELIKNIDFYSRQKSNEVVLKKFHKLYSNNSNKKDKFKNLFSSMKEFNDVRANMLQCEIYVLNSGSIESILERSYKLLENIISKLQDDDVNIDKEVVTNILKNTEYFAKTVDAYGILLESQLTLEHNYIESINTIYENKV